MISLLVSHPLGCRCHVATGAFGVRFGSTGVFRRVDAAGVVFISMATSGTFLACTKREVRKEANDASREKRNERNEG